MMKASKSICLVLRMHNLQSLSSNAVSYSFSQSCLACQSFLKRDSRFYLGFCFNEALLEMKYEQLRNLPTLSRDRFSGYSRKYRPGVDLRADGKVDTQS